MPSPNYPHPTPDPNAANYNVEKPKGPEVNQLPDLTSLAANVKVWLAEIDPSIAIKTWCDLTKPGAVLIVGNGEKAPGLPGFDRLQVLNGDVPNATYHAIHDTWKSNNEKDIAKKPKFVQAGAKADYLYLPSANDGIGYSQHRNHGGTMSGFTDSEGKRMFINAHSDKGDMIVHEYLHTCDPGDPSQLGWGMDEGIVDFFARDIAKKFDLPYRGNGAYEGGYQVIKRIVDRVGLKLIAKLYFQRSEALLNTFAKITLDAAEFVKPGEEAQFNERLGSLNPLIDKFEQEGRAKFAMDVTAKK